MSILDSDYPEAIDREPSSEDLAEIEAEFGDNSPVEFDEDSYREEDYW